MATTAALMLYSIFYYERPVSELFSPTYILTGHIFSTSNLFSYAEASFVIQVLVLLAAPKFRLKKILFETYAVRKRIGI